MDNLITGPFLWSVCYQCAKDGHPDDSALIAYLLPKVMACSTCRKKWPLLLKAHPPMEGGRATSEYSQDPLRWWHARKSEVNGRLGRNDISLCKFRRRTEVWTEMASSSQVWDTLWMMTYDENCCPNRYDFQLFAATLGRCFQRTRPDLARRLEYLSTRKEEWRNPDTLRAELHKLDGNTGETLGQKIERYAQGKKRCDEDEEYKAPKAQSQAEPSGTSGTSGTSETSGTMSGTGLNIIVGLVLLLFILLVVRQIMRDGLISVRV